MGLNHKAQQLLEKAVKKNPGNAPSGVMISSLRPPQNSSHSLPQATRLSSSTLPPISSPSPLPLPPPQPTGRCSCSARQFKPILPSWKRKHARASLGMRIALCASRACSASPTGLPCTPQEKSAPCCLLFVITPLFFKRFACNRYDLALRDLQRAVALNPSSARV
jgi:hypothetical protein